MVVLINPAFEAMQLRPLLELARSRPFLPSQHPHLFIVTSQGDWATGFAFPAGRFFRSLFNRYGDDASPGLYRTAIGHYIPYVTHQLDVTADCTPYRDSAGHPNFLGKPGNDADLPYECFDDARAMPTSTVLLSRCDNSDDCASVAPGHSVEHVMNMPILNILTTRAIMKNHGDIWNPTMRAFLVQKMLSVVKQPTSVPATATATESVKCALTACDGKKNPQAERER